MEIVYRHEPTEEYKVDLPVEGMTIHRFHEEREAFDEASTIIWRVEHDEAIPQDEKELVSCVSHFDWSCDPESYRCNHEHERHVQDRCGTCGDCCCDTRIEQERENLVYELLSHGLRYELRASD